MNISSASVASTDATVVGAFNYLGASAENSLYRNGKVLTRRDRDGSDTSWIGADLKSRDMTVHDARSLEAADRRTLAANGFEGLASPLTGADIDFFNHESVMRSYYPQCEALVQKASGARFVAAFDHNVRSALGKEKKQRIAGGQQVQGAIHVVHGDYTLTSGPQRLRDLTKPATGNDTLRSVLGEGVALLDEAEVEQTLASGRFAIINVWRNIADEPIATNPLALCDAVTVRPEDLVVFEIHYSDRVGENYFAKHYDGHQWYFYPGMTRDEALLIKQWDSAGGLAQSNGARADASAGGSPSTFSFHSAFDDPNTPPNAPDRQSIEVRCVALY